MHWSQYTRLFTSEAHGHLLYNALTNTFAEMDADTWDILQDIKKDPAGHDFSDYPEFLEALRETGVLLEDGEEDDHLAKRRMAWNEANFGDSTLSLTVLPTLACNFACTYCFQHGQDQPTMDDDTERRLKAFIDSQDQAARVQLAWFGGEPTLEMERIARITRHILDAGKELEASMVTNGYLLPTRKELEALRIGNIQITIDGPEAVHDTRRVLADGGPTFAAITRNMRALLDSGWEGKMALRVNAAGMDDLDNFVHVHRDFMEGKKDERLFVYPGIVHADPSENKTPDVSCSFSREQECEFFIELYERHGVSGMGDFYPSSARLGCIATNRMGYVAAPDGLVYNCWQTVGHLDKAIGRLTDEGPLADVNELLQARMKIACQNDDDPKCRACAIYPVCDGGCHYRRYLNRYEGAAHDTCSRFKGRITTFLDMHYTHKKRRAAEMGVDVSEVD